MGLHGYEMLLLRGASITLGLALLSAVVAIALGLSGALLRVYAKGIPGRLVMVYTTLIRGIPDLALLLLIYYSLQGWISQIAQKMGWANVVIDPFTAGVITLGFIYGASFTETFRGALIGIAPGQVEAARAMGLKNGRIFSRIILPQMLTLAVPGITNNWLVLLKSTALVSIIGLQELVTYGSQAAQATQQPFLFMLLVGAIFLCITAISRLSLNWLSRKIDPSSEFHHV